ncbi:hypothetical protein ISS05_02255 [Candidatus Woesearchaeota archaeon]|nr:hypothetical protein [Candidatus Woesearchaeota archaeon]
MGKNKNKNKKKKVSVKKEKYAKFRKGQPSTMTFTTPEITPEQQKQMQEDENSIGLFWRYNKRRPTIKGIGAKSKR